MILLPPTGRGPQEMPMPDEEQRAEPGRPPERKGLPWWWQMLTSAFGLGVIGYEVIFDHQDRPWIIGAGMVLAVGGKVAEKWWN